MRVYNFSAGPAAMPLEVLEEAAAEITDWQGSGMSVMEVSHRGKPFVAYAAETEAALRRVMGISDDYAVLIIQGGAMGQFAAIPMNLSAPGDVVDDELDHRCFGHGQCQWLAVAPLKPADNPPANDKIHRAVQEGFLTQQFKRQPGCADRCRAGIVVKGATPVGVVLNKGTLFAQCLVPNVKRGTE